jgi:hypothetical protein
VLVALAVAALAPATSQASINVGSDLTLPASNTASSCQPSTPPCTDLLIGVHSGNPFPAKSPTKGIVTSFAIKTAGAGAGETVTFRLGRLESGTGQAASGAGTGPTVTITGGGIHSVPANLAVQPGDYVGIDTSRTTAFSESPQCGQPRAFLAYHPPLTDFGSFQPPDANFTCELLLQATIQPSSVFGFNPKQVYKVSKKFKIVLAIELPGPGGIKVSGKGLARAPATRTVSEAGTVKLPLKLAAKKLRRLEAKGKGGLKVTVTFTPVGGDPGTQTFKLKLKAR